MAMPEPMSVDNVAAALQRPSTNKATSSKGKKIDRSAFLYLEPETDEPEFAQCLTCIHFVEDEERCVILGDDLEVLPTDSCALYIPGEPRAEPDDIETLVSPEDAGFVKGEVRCENCRYGGDECQLYIKLNKLPDFDLDTKIEPLGCCNAFIHK